MIELTPEQRHEARLWLSDCDWPDMTSHQILRVLDAHTIDLAVSAHYAGGSAGFIADFESHFSAERIGDC